MKRVLSESLIVNDIKKFALQVIRKYCLSGALFRVLMAEVSTARFSSSCLTLSGYISPHERKNIFISFVSEGTERKLFFLQAHIICYLRY